MSWSRQRLESLASDEPYSFVGGPFGSKLTSRDYVDEGIPVIRGSNLNNGRYLGMEDFVFVSESKVRKDLSGNLAKAHDLIFTQRGTLGQVALIPTDGISELYVVSQSQMKLTVDEMKADRLFLYYYLSSRDAVERIMSFTSSSGVPHINLGVLRSLEVPVPPLATQKLMADILSTYDDLIENNRRRMALLEESARLLYQEWFVRLRFPGHEHTRIMDGVPEGWYDWAVRDFGQVITGKTPSTVDADNYGGEIPFIKIPDMHGNVFVIQTGTTLTAKGSNTQLRKLVPPNTLLMSCIGTIGVVSMTSERAQFNQQINAVVPFDGTHHYYLFFALRDLKKAMEAIGGGATMGNVNKTKFEGLKIRKPTASVLREFHLFCEPLFQQILMFCMQNQKLRTARDLLLPKLMNGEIAV